MQIAARINNNNNAKIAHGSYYTSRVALQWWVDGVINRLFQTFSSYYLKIVIITAHKSTRI